MVRKVCLGLFVVLLSSSFSGAAQTFTWGTGSSYEFQDNGGGALPFSTSVPTSGAFAQLILMAGVAPAPFVLSGSGVSGGDQVIGISYSANGPGIGISAGNFNYVASGATNSSFDGDYYVRVYNAANPDYGSGTSANVTGMGATYYFQSTNYYTFTWDAFGPTENWNIADAVNQQTTIAMPVPEPTTLLLCGLGMMVVAFRRKIKK